MVTTPCLGLPANGGCDFAIDPAHFCPLDRPVWRADVMRFTVLLGPLCAGFPYNALIDIEQLPEVSFRHEARDGIHLLIGRGNRVVRVRCEPGLHFWGGIVLTREVQEHTRVAVSRWFQRFLDGKAHGPSPEGAWLTPARQRLLNNLLRVFDGDQAGASQRELAQVLVSPGVRDFSAAAFQESAERKRIRRWLAKGKSIVAGGYRDLLRGQWPQS